MPAGFADRPAARAHNIPMSQSRHFQRYVGGATAIEWGVIAALVALVVIAAVRGVAIPPGRQAL